MSNEVGMGIVPEKAQARRYRDLVGRANQVIASPPRGNAGKLRNPPALEGGGPSELVGNDAAADCTPGRSLSPRAKERFDQLVMPHSALGRLMDLAVDLAGMTRSLRPAVTRKAIITWPAITAWRPRASASTPRT